MTPKIQAKIAELKAKAYHLAEVSTIKELKAKFEETKSLDMRRKTSWIRAIEIIESVNNFFNNPPEKYRELFAEIKAHDHEGKKLFTHAKKLANELVVTTNAFCAECDELAESTSHVRSRFEVTELLTAIAALN